MYTRRSRDDEGGNSMFMTISSSSVGAIIGRKGSRIREMEQTSGSRIKIHDSDSSDGGDRRIEIIGSPENQDSARQMIEQVLDGTFQDSYNGDGGGGGGGGGRYGGGGGNNACFKCGESGHFSRDCTSSGGGGGMSRGRSYGGGGGMSRGRSYGGGGGGGGGGGCYKCGENGHFARECTSSGGSDSYGGRSYDNPRGGSRW